MWVTKPFVAASIVLFTVASAAGGNETKQALVPGFYDPTTKTFTALQAADQNVNTASPQASPGTATARQGTMQLTAAIALHSVPANDTISATGAIYVHNKDSSLSSTAGGTATVTRNGSTAIATIKFPYWVQVDSTTTFEVTMRVYSTGSNLPGLDLVQYIAVPANKATTRVSFVGAI